jgi:hypothetical protein
MEVDGQSPKLFGLTVKVSEIEHKNGVVDSFYLLRFAPCRKDWQNSYQAWAVACTD